MVFEHVTGVILALSYLVLTLEVFFSLRIVFGPELCR